MFAIGSCLMLLSIGVVMVAVCVIAFLQTFWVGLSITALMVIFSCGAMLMYFDT